MSVEHGNYKKDCINKLVVSLQKQSLVVSAGPCKHVVPSGVSRWTLRRGRGWRCTGPEDLWGTGTRQPMISNRPHSVLKFNNAYERLHELEGINTDRSRSTSITGTGEREDLNAGSLAHWIQRGRQWVWRTQSHLHKATPAKAPDVFRSAKKGLWVEVGYEETAYY